MWTGYPKEPRNLTVKSSSTTAVVDMEWSPPTSDKHEPVDGYVVKAHSENWSREWVLDKSTTQWKITNAPLCSGIKLSVASRRMTLTSEYVYSSVHIGLRTQS